MLYIKIFCIFLSIFLFSYNKNLLSQKIIMVLNCKIPIRTYKIYYMGFRYNNVVSKSIYLIIGVNIRISPYHELVILVGDGG